MQRVLIAPSQRPALWSTKPYTMSGFETTVGLEVHIRLKLRTKLFSPESYTFGEEPNTQISPVSLGYPGSLPVVNQDALALALRLGIACRCEIADRLVFDRKNYFYPDLPKGYQITQDTLPICSGGFLEIETEANGQSRKKITLTKIHLEEDAGKLQHSDGEDASLVDYNRAGTALVEMVTDPCLSSGDEAYHFLAEVRRLVRCLDVSDGNMEEGSLRCDTNVSVRRRGEGLGNKVEIKNLNSFQFVKDAIEHEVQRQEAILREGSAVTTETRLFDSRTGITHEMREKETLDDYRYFPDPDLPIQTIPRSFLDKISGQLPELPWERRERFRKEYGLNSQDAHAIMQHDELASLFDQMVQAGMEVVEARKWVLGPVLTLVNNQNDILHRVEERSKDIGQLAQATSVKDISFDVASKSIFPRLMSEDGSLQSLLFDFEKASPETDQLRAAIDEVMQSHLEEVTLYRKGKKKVFGMLMGVIKRKLGSDVDARALSDQLRQALEQADNS